MEHLPISHVSLERKGEEMISRMLTYLTLFTLASPLLSGPWAVDLEETMADLPWVITGELLEVHGDGVSLEVADVFRGDFDPGDTLQLYYWEMGSSMEDMLKTGREYLLLPDESGDLQIAGTPGDGFWVLGGEFDFNAFWVYPGVLSPEELRLLCSGEKLPRRLVDVEIWFAGGSRYADFTLSEADGEWSLSSGLECFDGLLIDDSQAMIGGRDTYVRQPDVGIWIRTTNGDRLQLEGMVLSCCEGEYSCRVYPTAPMIFDLEDLMGYMNGDVPPDPPEIHVSLEGITPQELGLPDDPVLIVDERGRLHLRGEEELLEVTSIFVPDPDARPVVGFDTPMRCTDPLYFDFSLLPLGPSCHLATDVIDALAKGVVIGTIGFNPLQPSGRFILSIRSQ
jgi:hypothetical protein